MKVFWILIGLALIGGCSSPPLFATDPPEVGGRRFGIPPNVAVNPTSDSLAFYLRASNFDLLDQDARGARLFIQIQSDRRPDIKSAIEGLEKQGAVPGDDIYGGLTPMRGGGGEGQYFVRRRYGGAAIFCSVNGWECRARVPYRDLSISIRFAKAWLSSWMRIIDGVLAKVETLEV